MTKICIAGGSGFIGSHLARKLKQQGHYIVIADLEKNKFFTPHQIYNEFLQVDLRHLENCIKATMDCEWVFNLAADMGGVGYIQSNHSTILYNNTMITLNMIEACRHNKVKRILYTSSACVYPETLQTDTKVTPLKESDAWPANPQDAYGLEKLVGEEALKYYSRDFGIQVRIARLHNIYGPRGTWIGGREKAPSAFCRKILCSEYKDEVEMWGDGEQVRSFCYIDDCVDGLLALMNSDYDKPLNIGSEELITMNELHFLICAFESKRIKVKHVKGPQGVRGRGSDNTLAKQILHWEPKVSLEEGLPELYWWMKTQIEFVEKEKRKVGKKSFVVRQTEKSLEEMYLNRKDEEKKKEEEIRR